MRNFSFLHKTQPFIFILIHLDGIMKVLKYGNHEVIDHNTIEVELISFENLQTFIGIFVSFYKFSTQPQLISLYHFKHTFRIFGQLKPGSVMVDLE